MDLDPAGKELNMRGLAETKGAPLFLIQKDYIQSRTRPCSPGRTGKGGDWISMEISISSASRRRRRQRMQKRTVRALYRRNRGVIPNWSLRRMNFRWIVRRRNWQKPGRGQSGQNRSWKRRRRVFRRRENSGWRQRRIRRPGKERDG